MARLFICSAGIIAITLVLCALVGSFAEEKREELKPTRLNQIEMIEAELMGSR